MPGLSGVRTKRDVWKSIRSGSSSVRRVRQISGNDDCRGLFAEALPFERRDKDILAAFVGDECRGVGEQVDATGKIVYQFEIRGKKDETASVYFMYYSMQSSGVYKAAESFPFVDEGVQGTLDAPFPVTLQPVVE